MITVLDYDPTWTGGSKQLRREYAEALVRADVAVIGREHVGSTSRPGLAAKPIIDCDIIVTRQDVEAATAVLVGLGFTPLGELGIPPRWAFDEPARLAGTNTYVIVDGSLALRNHLAFRDLLRADALAVGTGVTATCTRCTRTATSPRSSWPAPPVQPGWTSSRPRSTTVPPHTALGPSKQARTCW